ncbi:hypothetical protein OH76DRAFT_608017 [Lentinus brumalis]|uniref:Fibronectin type-III domain-containing protein n=1 Tax=Lentinus brumalis TaxID=2498619 RepID=A0A371DUR7_9APHY|nr:hypothetical protein OH76DRAFT_608017 [Polyporus brumalis]
MSRSSTSRRNALLSTLALGFLWVQCLVPDVSAKVVDAMQQSFYFSWSGNQATPIPISAQCEVLHITWGRNGAHGPNPVAPYYLQVYTSAFVVPLVITAGSGTSFDWPVPFIPGTQFQICMMASNGATGGCQEIYTVYQPPNTTLDNPPTCQNLTYPAGALDVTAKTQDGSWSQYGWIDQCTDITVKPNNGTPPFTYTIAPALRPPINFTSDTQDTVDWTVSLAFGLPFWLSVIDSSGYTWTNGPLHSGGGGSTACLTQSSTESGGGVSTGGVIGAAFGSLIIGLIVGALGLYLFYRRRHESEYTSYGGLALRRKSSEPLNLDSSAYGFVQPPSSSASGTFQRTHSSGLGDIDPYVYSPANESYNPYNQTSPPHSAHQAQNPSFSDRPGPSSPPLEQQSSHAYTPSSSSSAGGAVSPTSTVAPPMPRSPMGGPGHQHVYVVHHDGGRPPPVTVFTSDGTEVVELPPQYEPPPAGEAASRAQRPTLEGQRRQPRGLPAKQPRVASSGGG